MVKYVLTIDFKDKKAGEEVSEEFALDQINRFDKPIVKEVYSEEKPKIDLDINNDGVVDKKDFKIMAKSLGKRGGRPKKKKQK